MGEGGCNQRGRSTRGIRDCFQFQTVGEFVAHLAEVLRSVVDESQRVLGEAVKDVEAVDLVPLGDGQVKADQGQSVGFGDAKRGVKGGDEVRHLEKKTKYVTYFPSPFGKSVDFTWLKLMNCVACGSYFDHFV